MDGSTRSPRDPMQQMRMDGLLESSLTGAGGPSDPMASLRSQPVYYGEARAKEAYRASWAAAREIDTPAGDLVAGELELRDLPPGFDAITIIDWLSDLGGDVVPEDRGALAQLGRLWAEGSKLGGAGLVCLLDDGLPASEPVDLTRIKSFVGVELLERGELTPWRPSGTGPVEFYIIGTPRTAITAASIVHHTRVITSRGVRLSPREEFAANGWGVSALERLHVERQAMHLALQEMGAAIARSSMDVAYFAELAEMLCEDNGTVNTNVVKERIKLMSWARGIHHMIPMDAGREAEPNNSQPGRPSDKFESIGRPVTGLAQLGKAVEDHWAGATGQTPSIALGKQVGGLNTGEHASDWQSYGSRIERMRRGWLWPRFDRILLLACAAKQGPTGGRIPETWRGYLPPLWTPSPKEEAETAQTWANVHKTYVDMAACDPEEVRVQVLEEGSTGPLRLEPKPEVDPLAAGDVQAQALNGAQMAALQSNALATMQLGMPVETSTWLVQLGAPEADPAQTRAALEAAYRAGLEQRGGEPAVQAVPTAATPAPVDDTRTDTIEREGGWWVVRSKAGRKLGRYRKRAEAERRLAQVESFAGSR